ncbi:hypothetical protein [Bradyrhizobium sp. S69]|nr:hypothetical protein [Bradyrhizobium sp. S69]
MALDARTSHQAEQAADRSPDLKTGWSNLEEASPIPKIPRNYNDL